MPGAGASPLFPPTHQSAAAAQEELRHLVGRAPELLGQAGSRWQLRTVRAACTWLEKRSLSGVWRTLKRSGLRLKRGRAHIHSPDLAYVEKLADIVAALEQAVQSEGRIVLLFADELSCYRQPSLARDWSVIGRTAQPQAEHSRHRNSYERVIGGLNALSGQTTTRQASQIDRTQLVAFWQDLRAAYPQAELIYVVLDNWPVHFHPDVLAALAPQQTRWDLRVPSNWTSAPSAQAQRLNLPIQLLPLPTYASWCNPIEKLWRWLKQELLHLHRYAEEWPTLKRKIQEFLDRFRHGSAELLRYVGLTPKSKLYGAVLAAAQPGSG